MKKTSILVLLAVASFLFFGTCQVATAAITPSMDKHTVRCGEITLTESKLNGSSGHSYVSGLRNNWIRLHYLNSAGSSFIPSLDDVATLYYTKDGTNPTESSSLQITLTLENAQSAGPTGSGYYSGNLTAANFSGLSDGAEIAFIVKVTGSHMELVPPGSVADVLWDNNTDGWGEGNHGYRYKLDMGAPVITDSSPGATTGGAYVFNATVEDISGVSSVHVNYRFQWADGHFSDNQNKTMIIGATGAKYYLNETTVPENATAIFYNFSALDTIGTWASTGYLVGKQVADYSKPESHANPIAPYNCEDGWTEITADADDNIGVTRVSLYANYSEDNTTFEGHFLVSADYDAPWEWNFTSPNGTGYYRFATIAEDAAGNIESAKEDYEAIVRMVSAATSTAPGKVGGLTATAGNAQVSLSWSAPSDGGSPITAYRIYRGTSSGGETLLTTVTAASYTNTGLINGVKYYYQVSAVNANGEGQRSDERSATPQAPTTPPPSSNNPPVRPSAPSPSNGETGIGQSATLAWTCSDPDGDSISYEIYFGTTSSPSKEGETSQKTYDVSGLLQGATYYWKVVAKDSKGASAESYLWQFTTGASINNPPAVPQAIGPSSGYVGEQYTFKIKSSDADGDNIKYSIDWNGDGEVDETTPYYSSGAQIELRHSWGESGEYDIAICAIDSKLGASFEKIHSMEVLSGTDADSDGDGLSDMDEDRLGTDKDDASDIIDLSAETNGKIHGYILVSTGEYYDAASNTTSAIEKKDIDNDDALEILFDSDGNGKYDRYYDIASSEVKTYGSLGMGPELVVIIAASALAIILIIVLISNRK